MAKLSELINQMIQKILESAEWTSANPTHINTLIQVNEIDSPDFEKNIEEIIDRKEKEVTKKATTPDTDKKKDTLKLDDTTKRKIDSHDESLSLFESGNVGQLQGFTTEQFGNIRNFATDPFGFVVGRFLRKFKTGLGVLFIATVAGLVAKFLIGELFAEGRPLDRRFREMVDQQIIKFLDRKEQQELKQAFKSIITTTQPGLRGQSLRGQIGGNFFTPGRIPSSNVKQPNLAAKARDLITGPVPITEEEILKPIDIINDPVVVTIAKIAIETPGPIFSNLVIKPIIDYVSRNPNTSDSRKKSYDKLSVQQKRAQLGWFGRR